MSFFHSHSLWWLSLGVFIAAMYLARFRRSNRQVSTMLLWERTFARRSPWHRWRRIVAAAAHCSVLLLMVLALAHPFWTSAWRSARTIVVVVDTSAGMNAVDVAPTRLGHGCQAALRLVGELRRYERMAVLSAGGTVRVQRTLTDDQDSLARAIAALRPGDGGDCMQSAVRLAQQMLEGAQNPQVLLISDGCFEGATDLAEAENVHLLVQAAAPGETPGNNVGITRLGARRSLVDPQTHEVFVKVANFGSVPVSCPLQLELGGEQVASEVWQLEADQSRGKVFLLQAAAGGLVSATLQVDDQLAADNRAGILIESYKPYRIRVQGRVASADQDAPHNRLVAALRGLPMATVEISSDESQEATAGTIHVYDALLPNQLPDGPVLAIAPQGSCSLWEATGLVRGPHVARHSETGSELAIFGDLDLPDLVIDALVSVDYRQPPDLVLSTEAGAPLISAWDRPEGRVLLLHTPLDKSDFTRRRAFPLFVADAVRWLDPHRDQYRAPTTTRDTIVLADAANGQPRQVRSPSGNVSLLAAGQTWIGPLQQTGIWRVERSAGNVYAGDTAPADTSTDHGILQVVAVNLLDARESDLRPDQGLPPDTSWPTTGRTSGPPLWTYFLLAAVVALLAEWVLYQRKVVV